MTYLLQLGARWLQSTGPWAWTADRDLALEFDSFEDADFCACKLIAIAGLASAPSVVAIPTERNEMKTYKEIRKGDVVFIDLARKFDDDIAECRVKGVQHIVRFQPDDSPLVYPGNVLSYSQAQVELVVEPVHEPESAYIFTGFANENIEVKRNDI